MHLIHLTSSFLFGGPERQMLGLAQTLPAEWRTTFVSFAEGGHCGDFLEQVRAAGFEGIQLHHDFPRLLAALHELAGFLRCHPADVLLCHGYKANVIGLLAARQMGVPVLGVSRGWTSASLRVRLYEALDRRVLRWMDKVVCVSDGQAAKVRRAGVPDSHIAVIRNAIRPDRFGSRLPEYRERLVRMFPSPPEKVVGAAGRLSPEKGFEVLVEAARLVVSKVPKAGFVLFGDGPLRERLARRIVRSGLQDHFILAGFSDQMDRFMPYFDVFALPSYTEGLSNVALEALAAGVPVVATSVGGNPEVVVDGLCGRLVPPGDARSLAISLGAILADGHLRKILAAEGPRRAADEFSFRAQASAYEQLLTRLTTLGTSGNAPGVQPNTATALHAP